jgi:ribose transport system ATP-binding protein
MVENLPQVPNETSPILAARDVNKAYGPVTVLQGINVKFVAGEIHAIVGENGAGKSTLMKILSGIVEPSLGQVLYEGKPVETGNLRSMENLGIRLIHQELNLAEDLSVLENLFLGEEQTWGPFLDEARMRGKGREVLAKVGADVDLDAPIRDLRVSEKQLVEIAKAIAQRVTVLILDEPTASLTQRETERLFQMVGRNLQDLFPRKISPEKQIIVLEVRDLSVPGYVKDASFTLGKGEILGFAGLIGAGRTELWEAILGLRKAAAGTIFKDGLRSQFTNYSDALQRLRAVYLSEDRKGKGLVVSFDAQTNYSLLGLKRFGSWFIDQRKERNAFREAIEQFQIKVSDRSMPVSRLSGGNQQKVLLAKILALDPEIIVFDEPTRGIDVGTKAQIYHLIASMAAQGRACVVISSELLEIIGLCHRVMVMRSSRIVASLDGSAINEDEIMLYATGVKSPQTFSSP